MTEEIIFEDCEFTETCDRYGRICSGKKVIYTCVKCGQSEPGKCDYFYRHQLGMFEEGNYCHTCYSGGYYLRIDIPTYYLEKNTYLAKWMYEKDWQNTFICPKCMMANTKLFIGKLPKCECGSELVNAITKPFMYKATLHKPYRVEKYHGFKYVMEEVTD